MRTQSNMVYILAIIILAVLAGATAYRVIEANKRKADIVHARAACILGTTGFTHEPCDPIMAGPLPPMGTAEERDKAMRQTMHDLELTIQTGTPRAETYALLAPTYDRLNRSKEAMAAYEELAHLRPNDMRTLARLADLYLDAHKCADAWRVIDTGLKHISEEDTSYASHFLAASLRGFGATGLEQRMRTALARCPDIEEFLPLLKFELHILKGEYEQAEAIGESMTQRPEEGAGGHMILAQLQLLQGDKTAAMNNLKSIPNGALPPGMNVEDLLLQMAAYNVTYPCESFSHSR